MQDAVEGTYDSGVSIEKVGGIDRFDDFIPNGFFDDVHDAESARVAVGKIRTLEEMLRAVDRFGECAVQFCVLEAQMYINISEIDGAEDKLTSAKKRLVRWIRSKSDTELDEVMSEVSQGVRIASIERRDNSAERHAQSQQSAEREYHRIQDKVVGQLLADGHTQLTPSVFVENWQADAKPDIRTVRAYVESTRDKIIRKNGRGLGDGDGTYMLVDKCDRTQVAEIVKTRLESIVNDLKTIRSICTETGFVVPNRGIEIIVGIIRQLGSSELDIDVSV